MWIIPDSEALIIKVAQQLLTIVILLNILGHSTSQKGCVIQGQNASASEYGLLLKETICFDGEQILSFKSLTSQ